MKKLSTLLIIALMLAQPLLAADQVIINSEDWKDVYSGMLWGNLKGTSTSFLVSPRHSTLILNSIPAQSSIEAHTSEDFPFILGYGSLLNNAGYDAEEIVSDNFNLLLVEDLPDITEFVIVDDSYGYNAVAVAPYAVVSNSYVLFVDEDNLGDVTDILDGRQVDKIIIYGQVDRQVRDALASYNPEIINEEGDRFANNIEIVKKYLEVKGANQVILTNGEFIEKEIMSGAEPVIFIGANNVPDQVRDFIQNSDIEIGVLVGNELVGTATFIRRNVGISVFVKFAQGARAPEGAISQVEALDMFYLPVFDLNIEIDSIKYNRATNQLEVNIRNTEEQATYFKGTYSLSAEDGAEQKVGDVEPIFLDGNELKTVVYDVEPLPAGKLTADAYVIYGESPGSMEKVLDVTVEIEVVEVLDECNIDMLGLQYHKRKGTFELEVQNIGEVDCNIDAEIVDLVVAGDEETYSAENVLELKAGKSGVIKIKARMEEEDFEDNNIIKVRAYYGERADSLVKIIEGEFDLEFTGVDFLFYTLLIVILLLLFLIIWKRRRDNEQY